MSETIGYCRTCGDSGPDSRLSNRGLCPRCWSTLLLDAVSQLRAKNGPLWEKWKRNYVAAMDGVLSKMRKEL